MNALQTQYLLTALILIAIALIAFVRVGALWLRLALIDILAVMIVKRLDAIGNLLSINLVSDAISDLVTLLAIASIIFAFLAAYLRRPYLLRAERERQADLLRKHGSTIDALEALRLQDELMRGHDWSTLTPIRTTEKAYHVRMR